MHSSPRASNLWALLDELKGLGIHPPRHGLCPVLALVCSLVVGLSLIAAGDAEVRQPWFLTCLASQQDWVRSSVPVSLWRAEVGGVKGKEACGEAVFSVTEGQMLSVRQPVSCVFGFCSAIAVITDVERAFPSPLCTV